MNKLETKYLKLDDIEIAYTEYGDGPVLFLLHGNSESKKIFYKYQIDYFKNYHTYALDSRGHGESKSIDSSYSIEQYSSDVIKFCKSKEIQSAYVIGYSDGGNISLFLGKIEPNLFRKIIAISPNYLVSGTVEKWLKVFKVFYRLFSFMTKIGIDMKKSMLRFNLMLTDIGLSKEDLNNIKGNIELLYAENDMIKEEHILDIHNNVPRSIVKKIDNCSHVTIIKNARAIREMKRYLEEK